MIEKNHFVIVCEHIHNDGSGTIRRMIRDKPIETNDSGWQALCGTVAEEDLNKAQVWSVGELLIIDPSLESIIESEYGCDFYRSDKKDAWTRSVL